MNDRVQRSGSPVTHAPISRRFFFSGAQPENVNRTIPDTSTFQTSEKVRATQIHTKNRVSNSGQTENGARQR